MAIVRWTEEAAAWLSDIHKYIAKDNPEAAKQVVSGIYERAAPKDPWLEEMEK